MKKMKCPWFHSNQWISPEKQVDDRVADGDKSASSFLSLSLSISISFFSPTSFTTSLAFLCVGLLLPFSILGFFLFLFFCVGPGRGSQRRTSKDLAAAAAAAAEAATTKSFSVRPISRERQRERMRETSTSLCHPPSIYRVVPSFFFPATVSSLSVSRSLFFYNFFFKCRSRKGKRRRVLPDSFLFFLFK